MTKTVNPNGIQIAYKERGSGKPIVLLHGFCGSSAYWDDLVPLLEKDFRVITPDLRGHGHSSVPDQPYTMENMAEDIRGLCESLQLQAPVLLGHSLGGYVTLAFAERYPDYLIGFGLIHSTGLPDDETAKSNRSKGIEQIKEKSIQPFIDNLIPKLFAPGHLNSMKAQVDKAKQIGLSTAPEGAIHTLEGMRDRKDRTSVIMTTNKPVLLVAGSEDQVISPDKVFSADEQLVKAELIEGAGHMSMYEAPDKLAEIIRSFVNPAL
ncbi:alpha/beta hydrolase [Aneurinibacillus sp. Ricciae_BoGa-3]|uniref:alpha/beta fold hydrolase n=1 Tax=Aneurinibacillus sp. Ricciae_BoGa-3 TaxID=3022697 RepID=UPI0023412D78|nr:alpha/beta hydrolase [Aneurinibacillus sp. Ricciae_BoGa-3]WCK55304.1 alpha/beta hydrolase [Aneurinibacillus sp. Ricciae_BoGa-3]